MITVRCENGRTTAFPTRREASEWAHWGHCCTRDHWFGVVTVENVATRRTAALEALAKLADDFVDDELIGLAAAELDQREHEAEFRRGGMHGLPVSDAADGRVARMGPDELAAYIAEARREVSDR